MNKSNDIRNKYPIELWVLSKNSVKLGDIIAFTCDWENVEISGEIIDIIDSTQLAVQTAEGDVTIVDFYKTIVYNVTKLKPKGSKDECTCTGWDLLNFGCKCGYIKK